MAELALAEVLRATGGHLRGDLDPALTFVGIELDAGQVGPGHLFVAVPGEELDGHELVPLVALRGAIAAMVARRWAWRAKELALPLIVVDEPVEALQQLAAARRAALTLTVVGVTGSLGKTSAKELIAAVLARRFATYRSSGNRNNEIGLPLSLLEMPPATEVAVLEMAGAYAPGELSLLADIARPNLAVVTNVLPVHLERMGSIEAIARTKAEVVDALPADGIAVLNGDDARVREMAHRCRGRVLTYGLGAANDVRAVELVWRGLDGSSFTVDVAGRRLRLDPPLPGEHIVELVLAALAVGHALGMTPAEMAPAVTDPSLELRLRQVPGVNGSLLLDDTYNATTASVLSALRLLERAGAPRTVAILGDMLELGPISDREHRVVGRCAAGVVDLLVAYGDLAHTIADEAAALRRGRSPHVVHFGPKERSDLVAYVGAYLQEGDVVLVKGSRSLRMEELVDALSEPPPRRG